VAEKPEMRGPWGLDLLVDAGHAKVAADATTFCWGIWE
jgi:hypothetical protein